MSTDPGTPPPGAADPGPGLGDGALDEEQLRAAYEAELARIRVEDILIQTVVSLLNLAARKAGLTGGDEEPDFEQVRQAIDGTTALLPLVEPMLGPDAKQVRDALSQLQLAYARSGAKPPPGAPAGDEQPPAKSDQPPAKSDQRSAGPSSSRLWVPGQ